MKKVYLIRVYDIRYKRNRLIKHAYVVAENKNDAGYSLFDAVYEGMYDSKDPLETEDLMWNGKLIKNTKIWNKIKKNIGDEYKKVSVYEA